MRSNEIGNNEDLQRLKQKNMNIDKVKEYVEINGLNETSRKRELVFKRYYLFAYLTSNGLTQEDIAVMFNKKEHSTISYGLDVHRNYVNQEDRVYMETVRELVNAFPIASIKSKRFRSTQSVYLI